MVIRGFKEILNDIIINRHLRKRLYLAPSLSLAVKADGYRLNSMEIEAVRQLMAMEDFESQAIEILKQRIAFCAGKTDKLTPLTRPKEE